MAGLIEPKESPAALALAYGKIAKSLHGMGEKALALEVLDSGAKKLPEAAGIHIARGEIFISSYNAENRADYLKAALESLETAIHLDPQNYLARLLASQIYVRAKKASRAKALLEDILKTTPGDDRATALLNMIVEAQKAAQARKEEAARRAAEEQAKAAAPVLEPAPAAPEAIAEVPPPAPAEPPATETLGEGEEDENEPGDIIISGGGAADTGGKGQWGLDEKVVIGAHEDETEEEMAQENLVAKLPIFSRLEGMMGIFLLDANGQPFKIINKAKLDENVLPSLIFNLFKTSVNGVRRSGLGSFQRGTLVTPIGTLLVANAFYATIALMVDNDSNMQVVETRLQRYLSEVTG
ncbi:MAG: tetratricopeptide repeat protein [Nitrospinae bacterium]|nr:tetratricopeptide repeat protein [Nitrospinota bacterium]